MTEPSAPPDPPHWTALSLVVFIIGLLILVPSGLCTGLFGLGAVADMFSGSGDGLDILPEILLVGGIPLAIGFVLMRVGLSLRKRD